MLRISYAAIILLPCLIIASAHFIPNVVVGVTCVVYGFAMLPAYYLDHALLGGIGYNSPVIFLLLAIVIAVMLWPLLIVSAYPNVWKSKSWRRSIYSYSAAFVLFVLLAAWKMTHSFGLFFG